MSDRTVSVRFKAVTSPFVSSVQGMGVSVKGLASQVDAFGARGSQRINDLSGGMVDLSGKSALAAAGVGLAAAAVLKFANYSVDAYTRVVGKIDEYQDITGAAAEESSRMVAMAESLGISTDALAGGMARLSKNVTENRAALKALGVEIAVNQDGSVNLSKTLLNVADAYQRVGAGAAGNAVAQAAFGRNYRTLLDLLERSRGELQGIADAAEDAGLIFTESDIETVREYEIATRQLEMAWQGLVIAGAEVLVPVLSDVAGALTTVINLAKDLPGGGIGGWLEGAAKSVPGLKDVIGVVEDINGLQGDAAVKSRGWADALGLVDRGIAIVNAALVAGVENIDGYVDAIDDLKGGAREVASMSEDLVASAGEFAQTVRDAKEDGDRWATSLDGATQSGLANRSALRGMVDGLLDLAVSLREQGVSEHETAQVVAAHRAQLEAMLVQLGFNQAEVANYLGVLGQIPGAINTAITVDDSQALAALARVRAAAWDALAAVLSITGDGSAAAANANAARAAQTSFGGAASIPVSVRPSSMRPTGGGDTGPTDAERAEQEYQEQRARNERELALAAVTGHERIRLLTQFRDAERYLSDEWMRYEQQRAQEERDLAAGTAAYLDAVHDGQLDAARERYERASIDAAAMEAILRAEHDRLVALHGYWSAEARAIRDEIEDVRASEVDAAEDRRQAAEDALDDLNRLLDDEQRIRERLADLREGHDKRRSALDRKLQDDQKRVLDDRRKQLIDWVGIEERAQYKVASSVKALAKNARDQVAAFDEWHDLLADARSRGVSDAAIEMLGLADGPQALVQLRMFARATDAEIADLNAAVVNRASQAGDQVGREQVDTTSSLGRMLVDIHEQYTDELAELTEDFLDEERELKDELERIGEDAGRSFAEAIAAGMESGNARIREAARALEDAAEDGAAGGSRTDRGSSGGGRYRIVNGKPPGGSAATHGRVIIGDTKYVWHRGVASVPGPVGADVPAVLQAGERVLSVPDNRALVAAVRNPQIDYQRLAAAVAGAAGGRSVQFTGPVHLNDGVDIDLVARRLAFAATPGGL